MIDAQTLYAALQAADRAAEGDSNDDEIAALQEALGMALSRWPELRTAETLNTEGNAMADPESSTPEEQANARRYAERAATEADRIAAMTGEELAAYRATIDRAFAPLSAVAPIARRRAAAHTDPS